MIKITDVLKTLCNLLRENFPKYAITFDNVDKLWKTTFYIEIEPKQETIDDVLFKRTMNFDIQLIPLADNNANIDRALIYTDADKLDSIIRPVFNIGNRHITVLGASSTVFDEILHYRFTLEFVDVIDNADAVIYGSYDLMQELSLAINYVKENEE